jgi:hypothetical protein
MQRSGGENKFFSGNSLILVNSAFGTIFSLEIGSRYRGQIFNADPDPKHCPLINIQPDYLLEKNTREKYSLKKDDI